jgi:hypothetical protein
MGGLRGVKVEKVTIDNSPGFSPYVGNILGREHGGYIVQNLESHIFKENNILYLTALQVIEEDDWVRVEKKFDDIGYCSFTPMDEGK